MSTIGEVARLAGVHPSTVSRVVNGKCTISPDTREKVLRAMEELDYHPNTIARSLVTGSPGVIGLALDTNDTAAFQNYFFHRSQFAIERVAQKYDHHVIVTGNCRVLEKLVWSKQVDGLVIPPSPANLSLLDIQESVPLVLLGQPDRELPNVSWVDVDNRLGSRIAVEHLLRCGYRSPAYLGIGPSCAEQGFTQRRALGYLDSLPKGVPPRFIACDGTAQGACVQALISLNGKDHPDAFLCGDNLIAFGLLQAAQKIGLQVPEDIGIVTFNNEPLAEYTVPGLTAIHLDMDKMGETTAEILFEQIRGKAEPKHVLIPPILFERESTRRMAVKGDNA